MRGRFAEARRLVSKARGLYEQLGQVSVAEANCGTIEAGIELLSGDANAAAVVLRTSCEVLELTGDSAYLATRTAELADVLSLQSRDDEAERWLTLAEASAAVDDLPTQLLTRCVWARLLARRGAFAEAENLAREAGRMAGETDALNDRAKTFLDLAEVLRLAGRARESGEAVEQAIELFQRKGNVVGAKRARGLLAEVVVA
jgi:tetratricopeptide (TPR) repeat protein